jgi:HEAT repeat protein
MQEPFETSQPSHEARDTLVTEEPDFAARSYGYTDDRQSIRAIRRRTTTMGKVTAVVLVLGAVALTVTYLKRNRAYETRFEGVQAAGSAATVEEALRLLREEYAKTPYDDVKEKILLNLGHYRDVQALPMFIDALHRKGIVRRAAAVGLARIGFPDAVQARAELLAQLPKTDARDRTQVVWALAVLREGQIADALLTEFVAGRLQTQVGFDPKIVADALGVQRLTSTALVDSTQPSVRLLVAQALSEVGDPSAFDALGRIVNNEIAKKLDDQNSEVIESGLVGIARTGDPRAAQALVKVLRDKPELMRSVLDALRKSASAASLAGLLQQTDDTLMKKDLIGVLRQTHDPKAAEALARALADQDPDVRRFAAVGLAEMGDERSLRELVALASGEDERRAKEALVALDGVSTTAAVSALTSVATKYPARRALVLRALGNADSPAATATLIQALSGDDQHAAAMALARRQDPSAYLKLLAMVTRPANIDFSDPSAETENAFRRRFVALQAASKYERPEGVATFVRIVEDRKDDRRMREVAAEGIGRSASRDEMIAIIRKVTDSSLDEDSRRAYGRALWQRPRADLSNEWIALIRSSAPSEARLGAGIALGYAASRENDQPIAELLQDKNTRRPAAFAAMLSGSDAVTDKLLSVLREDKEFREVMETAFGADHSGWMNVLRTEMFRDASVYRRLRGASRLNAVDKQSRFGAMWNAMLGLLRKGDDFTRALSPQAIRVNLVEALNGPDASVRSVAAEALGGLDEFGLLIAVRDSDGLGAQEARRVWRSLVRGGVGSE